MKGCPPCHDHSLLSYDCELSRSFEPAKPLRERPKELGVSQAALHGWVQDKTDRVELPGVSTKESAELKKAKRRIRELEKEVEILRRASKILGDEQRHPNGFTR